MRALLADRNDSLHVDRPVRSCYHSAEQVISRRSACSGARVDASRAARWPAFCRRARASEPPWSLQLRGRRRSATAAAGASPTPCRRPRPCRRRWPIAGGDGRPVHSARVCSRPHGGSPLCAPPSAASAPSPRPLGPTLGARARAPPLAVLRLAALARRSLRSWAATGARRRSPRLFRRRWCGGRGRARHREVGRGRRARILVLRRLVAGRRRPRSIAARVASALGRRARHHAPRPRQARAVGSAAPRRLPPAGAAAVGAARTVSARGRPRPPPRLGRAASPGLGGAARPSADPAPRARFGGRDRRCRHGRRRGRRLCRGRWAEPIAGTGGSAAAAGRSAPCASDGVAGPRRVGGPRRGRRGADGLSVSTPAQAAPTAEAPQRCGQRQWPARGSARTSSARRGASMRVGAVRLRDSAPALAGDRSRRRRRAPAVPRRLRPARGRAKKRGRAPGFGAALSPPRQAASAPAASSARRRGRGAGAEPRDAQMPARAASTPRPAAARRRLGSAAGSAAGAAPHVAAAVGEHGQHAAPARSAPARQHRRLRRRLVGSAFRCRASRDARIDRDRGRTRRGGRLRKRRRGRRAAPPEAPRRAARPAHRAASTARVAADRRGAGCRPHRRSSVRSRRRRLDVGRRPIAAAAASASSLLGPALPRRPPARARLGRM